MDQAIKLFLKESVEMELNVGEVYQIFSVKFPGDYDFWWKISMEEMNHAALIESINDIFLTEGILMPEEIEKQAEVLRKLNLIVKERIERYKLVSPTRAEAFNYGFELENSVGEFHFQFFMTSESNSQMTKIFQKLNGDDVNHAKRIDDYLKANNIV
jgi:hypothetical protein